MVDGYERALSRLPDGSERRDTERYQAATTLAAAQLLAAALAAAESITAATLLAAQRATAGALVAHDRGENLEGEAQTDAAKALAATQTDAATALAATQTDAATALAATQTDAANALAAAAQAAAERLAEVQVEAAHELVLAEEQFRSFMDWSGVAGCTVSIHGVFLRVNKALCILLGRSEAELVGSELISVIHPDDVGILSDLIADLPVGHRTGFRTLSRYLASDGRVIWGDLTLAAVLNSDGTLAFQIAQILDVTDRVEHEAALQRLATHDSLTGLANRAVIQDEITRAIRVQTRSGRSTAILVMDLDNFKKVNDSRGHATGDEVLKAAAQRIENMTRAGDLAARLGGDEFTMVMRDLDNPADAVRVALRLVEAFRQPFVVSGNELSLTLSIGVAIASDIGHLSSGNAEGAENADELLREADAAMYTAKAEGRDRVSVFNEDLRATVSARLAVEGDLRHSLNRNQLAVWYQPEVDLRTGAVTAVEALLRWHHPDGNVWTADRFIGVAEDTGLTLSIGDWVLHQACTQAAAWADDRSDRPLIVRVNKSPFKLATTACCRPLTTP